MSSFIYRGKTGLVVVILATVFVLCVGVLSSPQVIVSTKFEKSYFNYNAPSLISENINTDIPVISINENTREREIKGEDIEYYGGTLEDFQVQDLIFRPLEWIPGEEGIVSFGISMKPYWLRFRIQNTGNKPLNEIFEISNPILDYVSIYAVKNQEVLDAQILGDNLPFDVRKINHRNFLFSFSVEPHDYVDMYIAVRSDGSLQVPMRLWEEKNFYFHDQANQLWQGFFYGSLVLMLVYNFFIFISLRERSYFFYVLFVLSALMSQASVRGDAFQYLWPENVWLSTKSAGFFTIAMVLTAYAFMIDFLQLKMKAPISYKFFIGMEIFFSAMLISMFFAPYSIVMILASYASIPAILMSVYIAIKLSYKKDRTAQYFTLAWMSFSVGLIIFVLSKVGVLPRIFLTEYGIQIGVSLNAALLSFALTDRINRANKNFVKAQHSSRVSNQIAREAQQEAMRVQKQANETLESNVMARTIELQSALNELSELNLKLEDLSSTDALTNLKNRGYFETQYDDEWKRANREKIPLALLMVDVDFFKKINDKYGHLAGDMCIKEVASSIKQAVRRPIDTIARYGGEEFVIILPGTDVEGARIVAENIRKNIEMLKLDFEGSPILMTASVGLASLVPNDENDRALIAHADKALYKAKLTGRNRVVISKKNYKDEIFKIVE